MAENSSISWTDHTWNPWIGCSKVKDSPACDWCYAWWMDVTKFSKTLGGGTKEKPISHWGKGAPRYRTSADAWKQPYKWDKKAAKNFEVDLLARRPRVFSLSLGDWLDEEVPIEWLADMLKVIHDTPNLDWLLLTKRPENWKERIMSAYQLECELYGGSAFLAWCSNWIGGHEAPANVRIGITAENQPNYDKRMKDFLNIPARSRFISIEPMVSPIQLSLEGVPPGKFTPLYSHIDQIIVGGESGHHYKDRILDLEAVADIYAQCKQWGVKFFMKQDSGPRPGMRGRIPDKLWVQEFPQ